jgi:ApaG protein
MASLNRDALGLDEEGDVVVRAVSVYLPEESDLSDPEDRRYVFAYQIEIENRSEQTVKLLSRHWWITDAYQSVREVDGEGVVGQQPVIAPGQVFSYSSWCVIPTPTGWMRGSYSMVASGGENLEVPIPTFSLAMPAALN